MITEADIERAASLLIDRRRLREAGISDRSLVRHVESGRLHRVRRGWFVDADVWRGLRREERHLVQIVAATASARHPLVFSHSSAAVLHEFPLYNFTRERVHVVYSGDHRLHNSSAVIRHFAEIDEGELCRAGPILFTGLHRTVIDVSRTARTEVALGVVDAVLGRVGGPAEQAAWLAALTERLDREPGAPGNLAARRTLELADGSADSVLESVSRLHLLELGFDVRTQVEVPSPQGRPYRLDFELVGYDAFGEVDGLAKYRDPDLRGSLSAEEVVIAEKKREDWIRGTTNKRMVRWGHEHLGTSKLLGDRLRAFGIVPPLLPRRGRHLRW